jgi:hypothetical protein
MRLAGQRPNHSFKPNPLRWVGLVQALDAKETS